MLSLNYTKLKADAELKKNVLYKIEEDRTISICEKHKEDMDVVDLEYSFSDGQCAFIGMEYRNPTVAKEACKIADIMTFVVDANKKTIYSFIMDIKRDISAFSDDLLRKDAVITAIKEVRDFVKQLHDENLQKEGLLLIYRDEGYMEQLEFGIATRSFEPEKFAAVADFLDGINEMDKPDNMQDLLWFKFKTSLRPYLSESVKLREFAVEKVRISGNLYDLKICLLQENDANEYVVSIPMMAV